MTQTILRIDASARREGSVSRDLTTRVISRFEGAHIVTRDLATAIPQIDESWIGANFTPADERSEVQRSALALSDTLVREVEDADVLVIGLPIYNFGVPASLKAWIDQVARAGVTFRYTDTGPVGLLEGKRAIVVVASGGTEAGSPIDYATGFIKHILGFIGIEDVEFVTADRMMLDADASLGKASAQIEEIKVAA